VKLKSITLQGFKSFADRTTLEFDTGITAIIGPNGCGKSNIVDAIRWVLGEQSAKQLRGERMEDVIFKGTGKRKPVGLCEVTLTFDNADRGLPIEFDEVAIRRRVTRDGISQYMLNGSPVRLRDLRDLFFDSGVGNTAYSVIEQEKINRILTENTQEVRLLIEEAAGIVKYKARRKEAERKLEQTRQDLDRLRDLTDEIEREVRSLQRQVGKARRYQRLYQQCRSLDLLLAGKAHEDLADRERTLQEELQQLRVDLDADAGELAELQARIEATRPAVDEREAERRGLEESLQAFIAELQQVERQVLLLEHRIEDHRARLEANAESAVELQRRRESVREEIAGLTRRQAHVVEELENLTAALLRREEELKLIESRFDADRQALEKASQLNMQFIEKDNRRQAELRELEVRLENRRDRLSALQQERERIAAERGEREGAIAELQQRRETGMARRRELLGELAGRERELEQARDEATRLRDEISLREARRESLRSRQELLQRIKESYHGYSDVAREILQAGQDDPDIAGSLADRLRIPGEWTVAFEALVGDLIDSVVVRGEEKALHWIGELSASGRGRASFLRGDAAVAAPGSVPSPGGVCALDVVATPEDLPAHLHRLLARTFLFADDAACRRAAAKAAPEVVCVSRDGLLVTGDGLIRGGRGRSEEVSLIGRDEKLEAAATELANLDGEIAALEADLEGILAREQELAAAVREGRRTLETLDADLNRLHVEAAEHESRLQALQERLETIQRDSEQLAASLEELTAQQARLRDELDATTRQRSDSSVRLDELRRQVVEGEQERDAARAEVASMRLEHSRLLGEKRELATALQHRQESLAEMEASEGRLKQEAVLIREELASMEQELEQRRRDLATGLEERERRRLLVQASAEAITALHTETAAWHDRVREIENKRAEVREQIHARETELATLEVRRANLVERIEEQYKGRFRELIRSFDRDSLPPQLQFDGDVFQVSQAEELLADARRKLGSLGAVNHLAVEEYEQKKERLDFLRSQLADVEKARDDLVSTIGKINRTARQLFTQTFEEVRRNYIAVFQTLFEGGRADLILEAEGDPLEGNISVVAQPRGKRVDHIRLLSGGERCLTALSLLFAVYLIKPSPFCLLDEADAPLDDSNVRRFVHMLQEFSRNTQFLVVTHNKLTMEKANHLYGVTMMEEGVSSLVSVRFEDVAASHSDAELGDAIARRRRQIDAQVSEQAVVAAPAADPADEEPPRLTFVGEEDDAPDEESAAAADTAPDDGAPPPAAPQDEPPARAMEAE